MAPTGHALRLLQTPGVVQAWARALMSILLKYQAVVGIGELGAILLRLSQALGRLGELLRDRQRARFIAVTRGASLPVAETARLVGELSRMKLDVPVLIVNATGQGECTRCRREQSGERRAIAAVRRLAERSQRRVLIAPGQVPPPRGPAELRRWADRWR
jgi:arsenite-transporting ATPase